MKRRKFIMTAGALGVSPFLVQSILSCTNTNKNTDTSTVENEGLEEFGLQLWTVKEDMAKDLKGTLMQVAKAGYSYVESFSGEQGPFWGLRATEFKGLLDELDLKIYASHIDSKYTTDSSTENEFLSLVKDAASIGIKYLSNPFPGEIATKEEWMAVASGLNRQGKICSENGIRFGYHNHHFEFEPLEDGTLPYDILLQNTDPALVDFELDLYWVVKAGQDPDKWLNEHGKRIKLCHVKDLHKEEKITEIDEKEGPAEGFWPLGYSCVLGTGQINYPQVLKTAKETGVEYFIVEQERFDNSTPLQDIVKDAEYMKNLRFA